jgi:serine/threonine-protein phosphatase 2B catalytic subunit
VNTIPTPPHKPLSDELLFKDDKPDWKLLRDHLIKEGRITKV